MFRGNILRFRTTRAVFFRPPSFQAYRTSPAVQAPSQPRVEQRWRRSFFLLSVVGQKLLDGAAVQLCKNGQLVRSRLSKTALPLAYSGFLHTDDLCDLSLCGNRPAKSTLSHNIHCSTSFSVLRVAFFTYSLIIALHFLNVNSHS
nr:MAG TPA: hypothetical protein [Caudoviricetes sp.]